MRRLCLKRHVKTKDKVPFRNVFMLASGLLVTKATLKHLTILFLISNIPNCHASNFRA